MDAVDDSFGALWRQHRPYVVDLAFRMLGEIARAEDVAQEAFIRLVREGAGGVGDVRTWLTVVTGRLCLDLRRSVWVRRRPPRRPSPAGLGGAAAGLPIRRTMTPCPTMFS